MRWKISQQLSGELWSFLLKRVNSFINYLWWMLSKFLAAICCFCFSCKVHLCSVSLENFEFGLRYCHGRQRLCRYACAGVFSNVWAYLWGLLSERGKWTRWRSCCGSRLVTNFRQPNFQAFSAQSYISQAYVREEFIWKHFGENNGVHKNSRALRPRSEQL